MLSFAEFSELDPIWISENTFDSATHHLRTSAPYGGETDKSLKEWNRETDEYYKCINGLEFYNSVCY